MSRFDDRSQHGGRDDQPGDDAIRIFSCGEFGHDAVLGMVLTLDPAGRKSNPEFIEPIERLRAGAVSETDLGVPWLATAGE